jgi:translocation and assembly module TamB
MRPETRARLSRRLRWVLPKLGWGALIAVGSVVVLVGLTLGLLRTSFGGERLRRFVLPRVNESIAGHLEIGRLRMQLFGLELWDVTLTDPEGQVVARIGRLGVRAELRRLLAKQIDVSEIAIDQPDLRLVQSARGFNLARAIAPRKPQPVAPKSSDSASDQPSALEVVLRRLGIKDGTIDFRDDSGAARPLRLEHLDVDGKATVALGSQRFEAQLALRAESRRPLAAPLSLRLQGRGQAAAATGELRFSWGDARVDLDLSSQDARTQRVAIGQIAVPAALVRAFVPDAPVRATFATAGKIDRSGDRVGVGLSLRAGDAHGELRAAADLARPALEQLHLALLEIDLAQLVTGAPRSRFDLTIEGEGAGRDLEHATGQLRVVVPAGKLEGRGFGPVRIDASAAHAQIVLRALEVALPGLSITGHGQGGADHVAGEVRVVAGDLGLTARSLRLPAALAIGGHGQLAISVAGRPAAAKLTLNGRFPALRAAGNELTDLTLSGAVADLSRAPAGTDVHLALPRARFGQQLVRDLDLTVASVGKDDLRLALTTKGPLPLSLTAAGRSSGGGSVIDIESLALAYPEATWRLVAPVRLRTGGGDLALGKLDLQAAPDQHVQIDLTRRGSRLDAHAALASFDLGRLPALVQPPGNRLAGIVDLSLAATGRLPRPDATIDVRLARATVAGKLNDVGLTLHAQHHAGRIAGKLGATVLRAQHEVDFDLPVAWPPPPTARLLLRGRIGQLDLAQVAALAKASPTAAAPPLAGQLGAAFAIEGPAGDPALSLTVHGQQLRWGGDRLDDIAIELQDPIGKPLQLALRTSILGHASSVTIDSPVVIGPWLRRPPDTAALLAIPFAVRAQIDGFALATVSPRTRGKPDVTGSVSARLALQGPANRLHGTADVDANDVQGMGIPATSVRLHTRLGEGTEGLDARLSVTRQKRIIAQLEAALGAGLDDFLAPRPLARLGAAKLRIKGHVGPLALQRMVAGADVGPKKRRPFRADVEANLTGDGTLGDPRIELRVGVQGAQLEGRPLGGGRVQLVYQDARPALQVQLNSAGGGALTLAADAKVDLSLPALSRGIKPSEIPINAKLAARAFNLAFLSGVEDDVRTVEGRLEADAQVTGKAGAPQMIGKLAWNAGRLVLAGQGDLRDIQLTAHGDSRQMVLERLFARSGSGSATVTAQAVRDADGRTLALEAKADLSRFRLLSEGQPIGDLTLDARVKGTVAPDRIALGTSISEARMELADGDRRDLQSLKRPDDVVLMVNGEPLDKAQARRYEALMNRPPPAPASRAPAARPSAAPVKPTGAAAAAEPTGTRITVDAPRNLWVRGADVNVEAGLDPGFVVMQGATTRIFGKVLVKRGFVEVLGRRFDVGAGSSVRFTGPADRPTLAIDATYKLKQSEKSDISVVVHVEGPADKLSITMSSPGHPEYGDGDLVSMVVTGRVPDDTKKTGFQADDKAKSLVGGLLASRVQKVATAHLPIDVLNIDLSDPDAGARLEAGTYLRDDVYVAYVGRQVPDPAGRENRNELHLEYQLTPRWSFEATYGDARRGSVDLLWTRSY